MRTLCFICISLRGGGTERVVSLAANHLANRYRVIIMILGHEDPFYELDERVSVLKFRPKSDFKSRLGFYFALLRHIRVAIKAQKPDVLLSFGELINPFVLVSTLRLGAPVIAFNRESPLRSLTGIGGIIRPLTYPLAKLVVVQTRRSIEILSARYRLSRFAVLPNPVEVPRSVRPLCERERVILNVGYLGGQKNQGALIRTFSLLGAGTEWKLRLIGDGPQRNELEQLAVSLNIADRVEFLGERKDVAEQLQRARIFAFTSRSEGFPNALAEALAHGCACISFDCVTGPAELIQSQHNGILVPLDDETAYLEGLKQLMFNDELALRLSASATQDIQRFSVANVLQVLEDLVPGV